MASTLHIVGFDGAPIPSKIVREGRRWIVQTNRAESGRIAISWPVDGRGETLLISGTLRPQSQPYLLLNELARGTLNRLRNQVSLWQEGGLSLTTDTLDCIAEATSALSAAIIGNSDNDVHAQRALSCALHAMDRASRTFVQRVLPIRNEQPNLPRVVMSVRGDASRTDWPFIATSWDIAGAPREPSGGTQPPILVGPLVDASKDGLAQPLRELKTFEERRTTIVNQVRETLQPLPHCVQMVHVISGLNGTGHRWLSYPQQLQLTIDLMELMEDICPGSETMVSLDAPWAERLAWSVGGNSPLAIADALLRRGLNISTLGLDVNLDYWPDGSLPRDPLQWLDLVDVWAQLGLPLVLNICAPNGRPQPEILLDEVRAGARGSLSDKQLSQLLEVAIPLVAARPAVAGICWTQRNDGDDPRYPGGGLFTERGEPKSLFPFWQSWRRMIIDGSL